MFLKIGVPESFADSTEKCLRWSLFVRRVLNTGVFLSTSVTNLPKVSNSSIFLSFETFSNQNFVVTEWFCRVMLCQGFYVIAFFSQTIS